MKNYQEIERQVRNEQHYDDWYVKVRGAFFEESERKEFMRIARKFVPNPRSVLDIGCGDGRITFEAAQTFESAIVCGVDFSIESLKRAKQKKGAAAFVCASAAQLPFKRGTAFDLILCCGVVLHWHLADAISWLKQFREMIRPGGAFVFSVPMSYFAAVNDLHEEMWGRLYARYFSDADLRYLAGATGFTYAYSFRFGYSLWLRKFVGENARWIRLLEGVLRATPFLKDRYAPWRIVAYTK